MKKYFLIVLSLLLLLSAYGCAADSTNTTLPVATSYETPPSAQDAIAAASADELRALITQYQSDVNWELAYAAAKRLTGLDPSDTAAYTAAADALLAMSKANCDEINRLLAIGSENAEDAKALVWWVKEHQSDLAFELPFMPDYDSAGEINIEGITAGNLSNAMKDGGGWKAGLLTSQGGWTYLSRPDEEYAIYKMRTDGSEYQRVGEDAGSSLNVIGDWLYYINLSDGSKIYKIRTDGKMKTKLSDDAAEFLSVSCDWMYYNNLSDGGLLYKVKTDGSSKAKLTEESVIVPCVSGDWVYFKYGDGTNALWRISTEGGKPQQVVSARINAYCIMDDWVFFVDLDDQFSVRRAHTDGTAYEIIYYCELALVNINYTDGIMYLLYNAVNELDGFVACRNLCVLDTATQTRLQDIQLDIGPVYVGSGGQMFFLKYENNEFKWYVRKPAGSIERVG